MSPQTRSAGERWPASDGSAHMVSDCLIEHLRGPAAFLAEAARVLAPRGYACIRTPNLYCCIGRAARLLLNRAHQHTLDRAQPDRPAEDIFPTCHLCNTAWALRAQLARHGFEAIVYGHAPESRHLNMSAAAYAAGVLFEKLAPGFPRSELFAFGQKG